MAPFPRVGGVLHCGAQPLSGLADRHGTPLYVYNGDRIRSRLRAVDRSFGALDLLIAYSVKANPNLAVLDLVGRCGAGADIVSGGELYRCLRAGVPPERVVFAGVGKSRDEMRYALRSGIKAFHVESRQELDALAGVATELGTVAPMGVRVNPDVESPTHRYTRTGHAAAKFGVAADRALDLYRRAAAHPALDPVGIAVHIGSQIRETAPFLRALRETLEVADLAERQAGVSLEYLDLGGGFGIAEEGAGPLDIASLGREVAAVLAPRGLSLVLEPGRFVVGDAGTLLTRVLYVKRGGGKTFVVTDAGMTELIRPSHYGGQHSVSVVDGEGEGTPETVDVVGPVCETGDFLALDRQMPVPRPGTVLCIHQTGAYGFTMASNYNSRPRPAEVLVLGSEARVVRERERYADLVRGEGVWE